MSNINPPTFPRRMTAELKPLAERFLKDGEYRYLSKVADMLVGFSGDGWNKLGDDERVFYLEKLKVDFHPRGMGDSVYGMDPNYQRILELIDYEHRSLIRKQT